MRPRRGEDILHLAAFRVRPGETAELVHDERIARALDRPLAEALKIAVDDAGNGGKVLLRRLAVPFQRGDDARDQRARRRGEVHSVLAFLPYESGCKLVAHGVEGARLRIENVHRVDARRRESRQGLGKHSEGIDDIDRPEFAPEMRGDGRILGFRVDADARAFPGQ